MDPSDMKIQFNRKDRKVFAKIAKFKSTLSLMPYRTLPILAPFAVKISFWKIGGI
jgi:hypothetical protein